MKATIVFLTLVVLLSCKQHESDPPYTVRTDIRLGNKFYSVFVNQDGNAYVIKGRGTVYTESLTVANADTSKRFRSDAMKIFFNKVRSMKEHPIINMPDITDASRIEIYCDTKKVLDSYGLRKPYMDLFIPIMGKLPKGYNPFFANEHPFD